MCKKKKIKIKGPNYTGGTGAVPVNFVYWMKACEGLGPSSKNASTFPPSDMKCASTLGRVFPPDTKFNIEDTTFSLPTPRSTQVSVGFSQNSPVVRSLLQKRMIQLEIKEIKKL